MPFTEVDGHIQLILLGISIQRTMTKLIDWIFLSRSTRNVDEQYDPCSNNCRIVVSRD